MSHTSICYLTECWNFAMSEVFMPPPPKDARGMTTMCTTLFFTSYENIVIWYYKKCFIVHVISCQVISLPVSSTDAVITGFRPTLGSDAILIEGNPNNAIAVDLQVETSSSSTPIFGSQLWHVDAFYSNTPTGSGQQLGLQQNILNRLQEDLPLRPGIDINFDGTIVPLSMEDYSCSQTRYLCFRLRRNPDASVSFNLQGVPDASALTGCVDMAQKCQGNNAWRLNLYS